MKKQKPVGNKYTPLPNPSKIGAKICPTCQTDEHLTIVSKSLGSSATFVEITCNNCMRTAMSEVEPNIGSAIRVAITRWNSIWPDVAYFIDGPSEGLKWMT